ncbi:hypothetical protein JH06_4535 [Blastocystis sp. subtype 4]|uniref:hypothetical protein n=1 Tax=Blastocystis sp. subtype 4 TaxID=944170 RepID=UPI000711351B|nr:hypothetical protein JH06_4535 [Blastocystis sp. subtype 4]KNB41947.1 hypothetical protein JH06_4535 [Blastocystis sp. subtype 4]|eukprot:XP_014525390.1 hypothetical protein JH06_4535 [Blastocystis sp. subtype 4]
MNTYGLIPVVIFLGIGVVTLPSFILRQLYPKKEINELYLRAVELDEDRFSFEMQVVSVKCNVREIMKQTKHEGALKIAQSILDSMPDDEEISLKRHSRGIIDQNNWLIVNESMSERDVIRCLSKVNSRCKNVCLTYQRKLNQFDELLVSIVELRRQSGTSEIPLETKTGIAGKMKHCWIYCKQPVLRIVFFVSLIFSAITVFTELTTLLYWVTNKYFSPFRWAYSLSLSHSLRILLGTLSLVYMYISVCFFYSYFNFPVPFISSFDLYPHHTDVFALAQNAINLCRFQFSLFYHYFTLLQVILPDEAYKEIALSTVLGQMTTIPFLGTEFNSLMPILVVLLAGFALWRELRRGKRIQSREGISENQLRVKHGQEMVDICLRKRGLISDTSEEKKGKRRETLFVQHTFTNPCWLIQSCM